MTERQANTTGDAESRRIAEVYASRSTLPADLYSIFEPGNLYIVQGRERATLALLARHGIRNLAGLKVLDVGCGTGGELLRLVQWGADPADLHGLDLLPDRIEAARSRLPGAHLQVADGRSIPYGDATFDLVIQLTVFSSILDPAIRAAIAAQMLRVLKPGGYVLWYDMRVVRPDRPLAAMGRAEILRLFPGCDLDLRTVTLNPLACRPLAKVSLLACNLLESISLFRSHYLALIKARSA